MIKTEKTKKIEKKAKKLMRIDTMIWNKHGWRSGGAVKQNIYLRDLRKATKSMSKLPIIYYYILEDANYHTLNKGLEEIDKFKGKYGSDKSEDEYSKYRKNGGRTWNLWEEEK